MDILKIVSSQFKLRPNTQTAEIESRLLHNATCLRNEPFSFQALYRSASQNPMWEQVSISVKCDLPLQVYRVDWCAVSNAVNIHNEDGFGGRFIFHISDEPTEKVLDNYRVAVESVREVLKGQIIVDALSDIEFYRKGLVPCPVAHIEQAEQFSAECDSFWLYYTGAPIAKYSNRLITNTAARERVLGLQLYYYGAEDFLHWAYNFYYNTLSSGTFDPMSNPCGYKNIPGATFLAYPTADGAVPSICEKIMAEAMDDVRAQQLFTFQVVLFMFIVRFYAVFIHINLRMTLCCISKQ